MSKSSFEELLKKDGRLIYTNVGDSMYPLIRQRDLLVIEPLKRPLRRFDVPLYRRDSGQYVLHRAIRVGDGEFSARGDNRCGLERGIRTDQVLGILTAIIRDGKTVSLDSPEIKRYERGLRLRYPRKYFFFRTKSIMSWAKRRLRGK